MKCSGLFAFLKINRKNGKLPHFLPISLEEQKYMLFVKNSDGRWCRETLIIYLKIHFQIIYHLLHNNISTHIYVCYLLSIFISMFEPIANPQIIQELVYYAESRFRMIILAMNKPQKGLEKRRERMERCLRQEVVCNDLIHHFEYFWIIYSSTLSLSSSDSQLL